MIPKSGNRFSEKIMLKQKLERMTIRREIIPLQGSEPQHKLNYHPVRSPAGTR